MGFPLTSRSMTLDFRVISRFWEATTAKQMKIDPNISGRIVAH